MTTNDRRYLVLRVRIIVGAVIVMATCATLFAAWLIFRPHAHRVVPSPNGDLVAIIFIQRASPFELLVWLQISSSDGVKVARDITRIDMWIDATDESFPPAWISDSFLRIGSRRGSFEKGWTVDINWPDVDVQHVPAD